jgi:hypothetical protein
LEGTPGDPDAVLSGLLLVPQTSGKVDTVALLHGTAMASWEVPSNAFSAYIPKEGCDPSRLTFMKEAVCSPPRIT